jgi:hypothetical protein
MRKPRVSRETVALALAACALFISLGGPAWAAKTAKGVVGNKQLRKNSVTSTKIKNGGVKNADLGTNSVSTGKLRNGAVTGPKLGAAAVGNGALANGAVTNGKLADGSVTNGKLADGSVTNGRLGANSVTSSKVQDGSLTSGDIAPNTFLAANGSAVNANALGGFSASQFATSTSGRKSVATNGAAQTLMVVSTGTYLVSCPASVPRVTYQNASTAVEFAEQDFSSGGVFHFTTLNNITGGTSDNVDSTNGNPFTTTIQTASKSDARVVTAWVNGHFDGADCVFTGQSMSAN